MHALKVQVNKESPIVAGAPDLCVLNAIINCVVKLGESAREIRDGEDVDLFMSIGGLTSRLQGLPDEYLRWASSRTLHVGDIVRVEIIETVSADPPSDTEEAERRQHDEREYFEHCKEIYLKLREKYEV